MGNTQNTRFPQVPLKYVPKAAESGRKRTVLSVCAERALLQTRLAILERAGFHAIGALSATAAVNALQALRVDAVVLCHTIQTKQQEQVIEAARAKNEAVLVISLVPLAHPRPANVDVTVDSLEEPHTVIELIRELA